MKLRISKISLKNFKVFNEITIHVNNYFNIIIGENNAGKSTIFEALQLWETCYKSCIQSNKKRFYQFDNSFRYLNYQDLDFLRITHDNDLFYYHWIALEINITLSLDGNDFELGFGISKPPSISNSYFRFQMKSGANFSSFAQAISQQGKNLDEIIFIYQTRPVAGISQHEPYYNEAQIKRRIQRSLSHEVLRNKIVSKRETISNLEISISEIIEKNIRFDLPAKAREKKDEFISLKVYAFQGEKADNGVFTDDEPPC